MMKKKQIKIPKEVLEKLYIKEGLSIKNIADRFPCGQDTIWRRIKEFGIAVRKQGWYKIKIPKNELKRLYLKDNLSLKTIGKIYGCNKNTIATRLRKFGITVKNKGAIEGHPPTNPKGTLKTTFKKGHKLWTNPQFIEAQRLGRNIKPNKTEIKLYQLLQKIYPNEYKFVGDGNVTIDGLIPDFINSNGQKKIIELFGTYWHREGVDYRRTEKGRREVFMKYGYKLLVIWEDELKNKESVIKKIRAFNEV